MKKMIKIEGMSCMHCVKHVEEALMDLKEVTRVKVDLNEKNALVELDGSVEDYKLKEAVEEAGYDVIAVTDV
jgi:copper ion binding protein